MQGSGQWWRHERGAMATAGGGGRRGGWGGFSCTGCAGAGAAGGRAGERLLGRFEWSTKFCFRVDLASLPALPQCTDCAHGMLNAGQESLGGTMEIKLNIATLPSRRKPHVTWFHQLLLSSIVFYSRFFDECSEPLLRLGIVARMSYVRTKLQIT